MGPLGELTSSFPVPKDPGPALKTNMGSVLAEAAYVPTHRPKTCRKSGSGNNRTVHSPGNRQVWRQRVLLVQLRESASAGKSPPPPRLLPAFIPGAPLRTHPLQGTQAWTLDPAPQPRGAAAKAQPTRRGPLAA